MAFAALSTLAARILKPPAGILKSAMGVLKLVEKILKPRARVLKFATGILKLGVEILNLAICDFKSCELSFRSRGENFAAALRVKI